MIDLHCHLLPSIDDGPATIDGSLELAQALVRAGVETVAATPHVNPRYPTDRETIAAGVAAIGVALAEAGVALNVVGGAEIDLRYGVALDDDSLRALALNRGPWLLIESPHQLHPDVELAVRELIVRGHRVLLAHPERSPVFLRDRDGLRRLVDAGVRTQITAGSLAGQFGRPARECAEELLGAGLAHVVASDAHDVAGRPPGMQVDLLGSLSVDGGSALTEQTPRTILAGGEVPSAASVVRRSRIWPRRSRPGPGGRG